MATTYYFTIGRDIYHSSERCAGKYALPNPGARWGLLPCKRCV